MEVCPAFIDETGIPTGPPKQQPIYGIGVLVIPDPKAITDSLYRLHFNFSADRMAEHQHIRRTIRPRGTPPTLQEVDRLMHSTRHHEYKFTDVTRFNLQQYIDLLNLYFSFPEPQFHAMMLDRLDPSTACRPGMAILGKHTQTSRANYWTGDLTETFSLSSICRTNPTNRPSILRLRSAR